MPAYSYTSHGVGLCQTVLPLLTSSDTYGFEPTVPEFKAKLTSMVLLREATSKALAGLVVLI